ncbi:farnesyl pyrophosphate synthase-like [Hyposmocoma kahamanoa]|uniref:farnesyl pyrophosphate synthase-like n=1 Tax=Hyposmocoma kahamanoa TaxID=1477025 RepID=UPI000E6D8481|nr:farnesyl pyrophosphate synthase-like [Hyposmocoma kahamanoa]
MTSSAFLRSFNKSIKFYASKQHACSSRIIQLQRSSSVSATTNALSESKWRETFQDTLPMIVDTLVSNSKFAEVPEAASWVKKILDYNLAGGKMNRGLTTVMAYEMMEKPENITEDSLRLARILGWCVEMMQSYFLIADDIMDGASTRRGVPCWYRLPEVGLGAINDTILLYTCMFEVLRTKLGHLPQYIAIVELFNGTVLQTSIGQHLDYTMAHRNKTDYSMFTMERYETIVKHKTAYYTYQFPVRLGMLLANITDEDVLRKTNEICLDIGKFFQMQDDYIDCYSDESISGKAGTDIQEGKCTWLAVTALQHFAPAQRAIFQQFYGSPDPGHVGKIKWLYDMVKVNHIYGEEEKAQYDRIISKAEALGRESSVSPKLFLKLVDMIYHRKQ